MMMLRGQAIALTRPGACRRFRTGNDPVMRELGLLIASYAVASLPKVR